MLNYLVDANTIPNVATKAKLSLLIGSEMIKDLEPLDPNKLTVKCFSNAKLDAINKHNYCRDV